MSPDAQRVGRLGDETSKRWQQKYIEVMWKVHAEIQRHDVPTIVSIGDELTNKGVEGVKIARASRAIRVGRTSGDRNHQRHERLSRGDGDGPVPERRHVQQRVGRHRPSTIRDARWSTVNLSRSFSGRRCDSVVREHGVGAVSVRVLLLEDDQVRRPAAKSSGTTTSKTGRGSLVALRRGRKRSTRRSTTNGPARASTI